MTTPFKNDPFSLLWIAFQRLYPDKKCNVWYDHKDQKDENGETIFGETFYSEDGTITVFVDYDLSIKDAVEILAHELAHVAVGEEAGHGEEWELAFDTIFQEYEKVSEELLGSQTDENT